MKRCTVEVVNTYFRLTSENRIIFDVLVWRRDDEKVTSFNLDLDTENGRNLLRKLTDITGADTSDLSTLTGKSFAICYNKKNKMIAVGYNLDNLYYFPGDGRLE